MTDHELRKIDQIIDTYGDGRQNLIHVLQDIGVEFGYLPEDGLRRVSRRIGIPLTEVYGMARHINEREQLIPESIITKAPSAELKPDQIDQDNLPPYDLLDQILSLYLLEHLTLREIIGRGYDEQTAGSVLRMVGRAEYKRRQAPPVLKVSPRAFGTGRRMPIARSIYEA